VDNEKKMISSNQMTNFSTFYYSVKENYQLKGIVQKMTIWIDNSTREKKALQKNCQHELSPKKTNGM
jgi:hypothetical protein